MRTTLKQSLATLAALAALMLSGTACTQDDPLGNGTPAGTALLQLGKVTIAGAETATRADIAATRADIAPDATTGFTGIRKHAFVKDDELVLTLTPPAGTGGSTPATVEVTATLDGTTWTLDPVKTYFTPGTTIDALYTATVPTGTPTGTVAYGDDLVAINQKPLADGTPLALTLTHANAMVEVTPPASLTAAGTTYSDLTISATPADPSGNGSSPQQPEVLATAQEGSGNDLRHRTIAKVGSTLNSISLTVNTVVYTAPISPAVVVAANKRYPITLKITGDKLVATVAAGTNWDDGGDVNGYPTGLTYYISAPADLVKLRDDVNAGTAIGADVTVLQTADIDMAGVDWTPIGTKNYPFSGSYNGNGYSIDKLTMSKTYSSGDDNYLGLFGVISDAKITGVHLRECTVTGSGGFQIYAGALVGYIDMGSIVTLCSATGSVKVTGAQYINAGGLVGYAYSNSTSVHNHFTRCSANVDVTIKSTTRGNVGGFAGYTLRGYYAGCIASGKVHKMCAAINDGASSGFSHTYNTSYAYHAIGCITNSEVVNDNGVATSAFGQINTLRGCLATGTYGNLYVAAIDPVSNVHLNALSDGTPANATPTEAWGKLTESNHYSPIDIKTLRYTADKGYTTDVVDLHRWYIYSIWKDNGASLPTIDMSYEGNPMPITNKNKVYRVNGYFVTAPAGETDTHVWGAADATTMNPNPCTGTWSMPTMKDFEAMAGWSTDYPWSESAGAGDANIRDVADADAFLAAFPANNGLYWSATPSTGSIVAWGLATKGTQAYYSRTNKVNRGPVRCVQKIAP